MLETVMHLIPEIYCFYISDYQHHFILQFSNFSLMSWGGTQQADPLARFLPGHSETTRFFLTSGYMNDIALVP